ncbi:hypothetical protein M422DRAFT_255800 [Sphaerobolus stellatus SS14]|uniref:Uncharacterized protein n=1 Tax=Sphaerobolus stellatus (strain SS14) TaxID=990650 RepID=A0A0C9VS86_SPHS4|nr:hypothetical protein M422DRAFT_255800 [Sphaerobolus stellatus SS14]
MEFWPAEFREDPATGKKKRRKDKEALRISDHAVQPGSLGAAALFVEGSKPEWFTLFEPGSKTCINSIGRSVEIFPATKPPSVTVSKLPVHRRAEQGARYLRTYHPDADFGFELIKEELQLDEEDTAAHDALDPYAGNCLAYLSFSLRRRQIGQYLAFPCGETGSELNISPFRLPTEDRLVFSPSASCVLQFDTPIQQISALDKRENSVDKRKYGLLAIRNNATVNIVKAQQAATHDNISAKTVTTLATTATGGHRVVNLSTGYYSGVEYNLLLVNETGSVYEYSIQDDRTSISIINDAPMVDDSGSEEFWSIGRIGTRSCVRISGKKAHILDMRAKGGSPKEILHITDSDEYLTSVDANIGIDHVMCFSTTNKLLWYDQRNVKRPIFSFRHRRAFDRALQLRSIIGDSSSFCCLSSPKNHLVTVYDVGRTNSGHLQLRGFPSLLPTSIAADLPTRGSLLFPDPKGNVTEFSHFQLSSRGAIWKSDFKLAGHDADQSMNDAVVDYEWNEDIEALAKKARLMQEDVGPLGGRDYTEANLRGIFEKMFDVVPDASETAPEDPESVYSTLDKMPYFWQDMNDPVDHILIALDPNLFMSLEPISLRKVN